MVILIVTKFQSTMHYCYPCMQSSALTKLLASKLGYSKVHESKRLDEQKRGIDHTMGTGTGTGTGTHTKENLD